MPQEPMRATLIFNEGSGNATSEKELRSALAGLGWKVDRCLPKNDLEQCLAHDADVIVAAGGDGTIAKVAKHLAGTNVPLAIIPTGTANNIARSLGIGIDP